MSCDGLVCGDRVRVLAWRTMWRKYIDEQQEVGDVLLPGAYGFTRAMKPLCGATATVTADESENGQIVKVMFDDAEMNSRFNHRQANYGFTSWMFTKIKKGKK